MPLGQSLKLSWRLRWLLGQFLVRELRGRYLGSISGIFWVFLQPIAQLAVYSLVFGVIFKVRFPELGEQGFVAFVAVALWPWLAFAEALQRATAAVQSNAGLVKKVSLPSELLVMAAVAAPYIVHGIGYLLVLALLGVREVSLNWLALPALGWFWLVQGLFTLSLGLVLGACQVFLRDLEHGLASVLMLWFYATPILYPRSLVPDFMLPLINVNPMSYFTERMRALLLYHDPQFYPSDLWMLVGSLTLCYLAWRLFRRCAAHFEDFL